jgi:predicted DNA-binding transcriptional regulator YafY
MDRAKRIGWIASCLRFSGRFGPKEKKALMSEFGVSEATISRDQAALFGMLAESDSAVEMLGGKLGVVDPASLRLPEGLLEPTLSEWLKVMLGSKHVVMLRPERADLSRETVRAILKSMEDRRAVYIRYASRQAVEPTWRPVSPHAVVNVAGRYHARCFDHLKGRYGDFVLTRVLGATFERGDAPRYVDGRLDKEWSGMVKLRISLREGESTLVGKLDYGLDETGSRIIHARHALAPYVIDKRRQGFDDQVVIEEVKG